MKLSISFHIAALILLLVLPAYGMDDASKEIVPLTAKIQAGFAAAAPLLVCPPLMLAAVPAIAATLPQTPTLATRSATTTALTMPAKGVVTLLGDYYIAPHSGILNRMAKFLAGISISSTLDQRLTHGGIIPSAPASSSLAEFACHNAVGYAVGTATERMIYTPYDKFMRSLDADYKQKNAVIEEILKTQDISDTPTARALQNWNPSTNPTTKHIKKESQKNTTHLNGIAQKAGITCKLSLFNGAILVSEGIWEKNSNTMQSLITKYTTAATEWHYLRPFGASAFSKEIKQLQRTVGENHVTAAGIPLKDIIQVTEESADL